MGATLLPFFYLEMEMSNLSPKLAEAIEIAMTKMFEQGKKSVNDYSERCAYRSDAGCCIIGHMITDENYSNTMEGADVSHVGVQERIMKSLGIEHGFTNYETTVLVRLQIAHDTYRKPADGSSSPEDFRKHLRRKIEASCGPEVTEILHRVIKKQK
jgi:hypothetical protein